MLLMQRLEKLDDLPQYEWSDIRRHVSVLIITQFQRQVVQRIHQLVPFLLRAHSR